jgi:hypothetical protein
MWFVELQKRREEFELTLSANIMFNNISTEWNNNSLIGTNNLRLRRKEKEQKVLPEGRSLKNLLEIDEEESMIYGCEETNKRTVSTREKMP